MSVGQSGPSAAQGILIVKNEQASQYEISVDGQYAGQASYEMVAATGMGATITVVMSHTEISPEFGGRGLASQLIAFALADIASLGAKVLPSCPFVAAYLVRHPELAALVAS